MPKIETLKLCALFKAFSEKELSLISMVMNEVNFFEGDEVASHKTKTQGLGVVQKGKLKAEFIDHPTLKSLELSSQDYFGELGMVFENVERKAKITAIEDSTLLMLTPKAYKKLAKESPHITDKISSCILSVHESSFGLLEKVLKH